MKVTVQFLGNVREITKTREQAFEISEPTVGGLVDRMAKEYGEEVKRTLINIAAGTVSSSVVIALNGVDIEALQGLKTNLKDGDVIAIFPPVAGGSSTPRHQAPRKP